MCIPLAQSWIEVFTCVAVICAGLFSVVQWRKTLKIQRAKFLSELVAKLRSKEFLRIIYLFDYGDAWYGKDFHDRCGKDNEDNDDESQIDNYLSWLSYLCHLRATDCINDSEMDVFAYEVKRVLINPQVRDYLYNVHHFSKANRRESPFSDLEKYAVKEKLICEEVFSNPSLHESDKRYHKNLNW